MMAVGAVVAAATDSGAPFVATAAAAMQRCAVAAVSSSTAGMTMSDNFLPNRDADLLAWSANFARGISIGFVELGISPEQAAQYALLNDQFAARLAASSDPGTRTRGVVAAKTM
jgi:hypothetical protein